jgi:hypothetical protein
MPRDGLKDQFNWASKPVAARTNTESWDSNENRQDFDEKENPPKPHADP